MKHFELNEMKIVHIKTCRMQPEVCLGRNYKVKINKKKERLKVNDLNMHLKKLQKEQLMKAKKAERKK